MAWRTLQVGRYVFIRWDNPEVRDLDGLSSEVASMRSAVSEPLILFSLIPASSNPPDAAFRKAMMEIWPIIMPPGDIIHAVLEGSGVGASLNRAVLTAMRMFLRGRGIGKIYDSIETAIRRECAPGTVTLDQLRAAKVI
jgi:hypothetical protein